MAMVARVPGDGTKADESRRYKQYGNGSSVCNVSFVALPDQTSVFFF